jgi:hypothetical protein
MQHAAPAPHTWLAPLEPGRDGERCYRDPERCRAVAVRYLDEKSGSVVRRRERAEAIWPVIAAAQAGSRDAHDRAEDDLRETQEESEKA